MFFRYKTAHYWANLRGHECVFRQNMFYSAFYWIVNFLSVEIAFFTLSFPLMPCLTGSYRVAQLGYWRECIHKFEHLARKLLSMNTPALICVMSFPWYGSLIPPEYPLLNSNPKFVKLKCTTFIPVLSLAPLTCKMEQVFSLSPDTLLRVCIYFSWCSDWSILKDLPASFNDTLHSQSEYQAAVSPGTLKLDFISVCKVHFIFVLELAV